MISIIFWKKRPAETLLAGGVNSESGACNLDVCTGPSLSMVRLGLLARFRCERDGGQLLVQGGSHSFSELTLCRLRHDSTD